MPRKIRDARLESRSARLKLAISKQAYTGPTLARGLKLNYRRCVGAGRWIVRASDGHGREWVKSFADADDLAAPNGSDVLDFFAACDRARELARGGGASPDVKPISVAAALDLYQRDLATRGAGIGNARMVRRYVGGAFAAKPVALITALDLRQWRDGLADRGVKAATINRIANGLRACLNHAAALDERIGNQQAIRTGLKRLPGASRARRVVLPDVDVRRIVEAAYGLDRAFGLVVEVMAQCGARISQIARLRVADLQADARLMMPTSFKGREKARQHTAVPIGRALAALLGDAAAGRGDDEYLLLQSDGQHWNTNSKRDYKLFQMAVARAGLDPKITGYALRHSAIVRSLLRGVPVAVVARLADTSVRMIELHYGAHIQDHADAVARRGLIEIEAPSGDNVVALAKR
jgi:integrase